MVQLYNCHGLYMAVPFVPLGILFWSFNLESAVSRKLYRTARGNRAGGRQVGMFGEAAVVVIPGIRRNIPDTIRCLCGAFLPLDTIGHPK